MFSLRGGRRRTRRRGVDKVPFSPKRPPNFGGRALRVPFERSASTLPGVCCTNGHRLRVGECLLSELKRTFNIPGLMSAWDPARRSRQSKLLERVV
jgi:hypothetical protein